MAIINEEIGDIFLAPPKSVLIRRSLSPKADNDRSKLLVPYTLPS